MLSARSFRPGSARLASTAVRLLALIAAGVSQGPGTARAAGFGLPSYPHQVSEEPRFRLLPMVGASAGRATLRFDYAAGTTPSTVQADWPVSGGLLGLEFQTGGRVAGDHRWEFSLMAAGLAGGPFDALLLRDWLTPPDAGTESLRTTSGVSGYGFVTEAAGRFGRRWRQEGSMVGVEGVLGVRYDIQSLTASGQSGWQLKGVAQMAPVSVDAGTVLARRTTQRLLPFAAVGLVFQLWRVRLAVEAGPAFVLGVDAMDENLALRRGGATTVGVGAAVRAFPAIVVTDMGKQLPRVLLGIDLRYEETAAWGTWSSRAFDPAQPAVSGAALPDSSVKASTSFATAAFVVEIWM